MCIVSSKLKEYRKQATAGEEEEEVEKNEVSCTNNLQILYVWVCRVSYVCVRFRMPFLVFTMCSLCLMWVGCEMVYVCECSCSFHARIYDLMFLQTWCSPILNMDSACIANSYFLLHSLILFQPATAYYFPFKYLRPKISFHLITIQIQDIRLKSTTHRVSIKK